MTKKPPKGTIPVLIITFLVFVIAVNAEGYKPFIQQPQTVSAKGVNIPGQSSMNLFSGSATYQYPIEVPNGVNNLQPNVFLYYNHQETYSTPTYLGNAWELNMNYISRDTEHTRSDTSDDTFVLNLNGEKHKLIYVASEGRYHTNIESYLYIEKKSGGNNQNNEYWLIKTKDGTTYRFGYNQDSELISNLESYTSRWSLDQIKDTHNNLIEYTYHEMIEFVYPNMINYGQNSIRFSFPTDVYGRKIFTTEGNKITQFRKLGSIEIRNNNNLVKKYNFDYEIHNAYKLLSKITLIGSDGIAELSPTIFNYHESEVGFELNNNWQLPTHFGEDEDEGVRFIDMNYDGLLDVVQIKSNGKLRYWLNNDEGWENLQEIDDFLPGGFIDDDGNDQGVRFLELNGDSRIDMLKLVSGDENYKIAKIMNVLHEWNSVYVNGIASEINFIHYDEDMPELYCPNSFAAEDFNCNEYEGRCELECERFKCWGQNEYSGVLIGTCTGSRSCCPSGTIADRDEETQRYDYDEFVISDDMGLRTADVDGDGFDDFLKGKGNYRKTWNGNGILGQQVNSIWTIPNGAEFVNEHGVDRGVQLVDVNSDGMIDIVKSNSHSRQTWLNNGAGWELDNNWVLPSSAIFINENEKEGVSFGDINGDSLIDIIKLKGSTKEVWLNNGNGWSTSIEWRNQLPSLTLEDYSVNLIDVNGDGNSDIIKAVDSTNKRTWINKAQKTYFLKEITNSFGGKIIFDYEKSTSFDNGIGISQTGLPFNIWVVKSITSDNGMDGIHNNQFTYNYDYKNGFYDYQDKEFRGFAEVEELKPDGTKIKHYFYQDDAKKGREYKTEIYDSLNLIYQKIENLWNSFEQNGYYIITLDKTKEYIYDGTSSNPKIKETKFEYDNYGNPTLIHDNGDLSNSLDGKYEHYEYVYNTNDWVVNKPKKYTLKSYNDNTKIKEVKYYYDYQSHGQISNKGELTKTQEWIKNSEYADTEFDYDSYGNLIKETDDNGHYTQYQYESTHTFPIKITNAKGQINNYQYDLGTGNLLSETDSNGYTISYQYDVFGRKTKDIRPYDSSSKPTLSYEYYFDGAAPEKIVVKQREISGQTATYDVFYFYDGFGNLIQTKSEAENNKQIVSDLYYDKLNRIKDKSNLYLTNQNNNYNVPSSSTAKTTYTYDPLSRITKIKNPDNTVKEYTYDHWKTYSYDENDNRVDYLSDANENIVKISEYDGNNIYITEYDYREDNNLIKITDDKNNQFTFSFDGLGRLTKLDDPDLGIWEYSYDNVGNLISQEDNEGNTINIEYDELNRIKKKSSSDDTIRFTYDQNKIGTLSKVTTSDITTNYEYDQRLRKTSEEKVIDEINFETSYTYDSMDRITKSNFPGSNIKYEYNSQNNVEKILLSSEEVIEDFDYNEMDQVTKRSYQNNLDTQFTYNNQNFRLQEIKTGSKQELEYGYDNVGNVKSINDRNNNAAYSMNYDELNRLSSAQKTSSGNSFTTSYNYDSIGNILSLNYNGNAYTFNYQNNNPVHSPQSLSAPIDIEVQEGCAYNNPPCSNGYDCVNNQCVEAGTDTEGCNFNNPPCESGYGCIDNECIPNDSLPDLKVTSLNLVTYNDNDGNVILEANIVNTGAITANNFKWDVKNSNNVVLVSANINSFSPNEEMIIYPSFNIDDCPETVTFNVDSNERVEELNEGNNHLNFQIQTCPDDYLPDLKVNSFNPIIFGDEDGNLVFEAVIENSGVADIHNFEWAVKDSEDRILTNANLRTLFSGEEMIIYPSFKTIICPDEITFILDPENDVVEIQKSNNYLEYELDECRRSSYSITENEESTDNQNQNGFLIERGNFHISKELTINSTLTPTKVNNKLIDWGHFHIKKKSTTNSSSSPTKINEVDKINLNLGKKKLTINYKNSQKNYINIKKIHSDSFYKQNKKLFSPKKQKTILKNSKKNKLDVLNKDKLIWRSYNDIKKNKRNSFD